MNMVYYSTMLEWTAFSLGTIGTIMWAFWKNQLIVSLFWLSSSIIWIAFAILNWFSALMFRDILWMLLYIVGIRTYWNRKTKMKKIPIPTDLS